MQYTEQYSQPNLVSVNFKPWIICFTASLFFFYEFIQGNMFASIAEPIMRDFHIHADKMTYLSSIYYLANVVFLFVAGFVLDRASPKRTILFAMLLCVISTFVLANTQSYYIALLCRFVTGIGSAFCFLGPVRIASRWFPPRRMALATGVIVTIAMSGGMLSQYPLTELVLKLGWRDSLMVIGWLGVLMLGVMTVGIQEKPLSKSELPDQKFDILALAKKAYLNTQTLRAALYTSLMNMAVAVFGAVMGQLYLMQRLDISQADAAMVNSMLFLGVIIGGPVIGWTSDKMGRRILPMQVSLLISLGVTLLILYAPVNLSLMALLFFCLGFFTAAQVISYALVAESNTPSMTATALSAISILTQGGYVVYQNLFSQLLQRHGGMHMVNGVPVYSLADYQSAAIVLPLGLLLTLLTLWGLKETHCRQQTS